MVQRKKVGSFYKQQLNEWKSTLDVQADTVFDIGGAQDPIKGMTKSWSVTDYKIVDLKTPHVLKQTPDIVQDMNEVWVNPPQADLIFCLGVTDYIINPNIFMDNIRNALKDNGTAWIEFPFAYAHHEPIMEEGCRYSEGCINRLANQANLEIIEIIRKMEVSGLLVQWYSTERQRMAKSYPYHGVTGFIVKFKQK